MPATPAEQSARRQPTTQVPPPPPSQPLWNRTITPDERTLFRYSALTFNTHRIHYDTPYTRDVEGYPGLLVHGPLTATYLYSLLQQQ